ncbi:hypothetical protein MFLAVUS_004406 [Mucor flavus]|uniref:Uncharacterized protein n=1 Tax=Mucor flavus TaxID=439312 RepID=A0ABP9YVW8_9FUNG
MKENKFMMGEEEETNKVTVHKKPTRHHVKRRSSGRVHVAKIAPMARANSAAHTDSEAELAHDESQERPTMRRSQSQRSLHRMSFDRKAFTSLTTRPAKPTAKVQVEEQQEREQSPPKTAITPSGVQTGNPASLSDRVVAAPVEQTFHATANNLVVPKKAVYPKIAPPLKPETPMKKPLLRSQFISVHEENPPITTTTQKKNNLSRTQQKLMLQRQQSQLEDESSPMHPRNLQKLNKELETLRRHYRSIRNFHDPMKDSLIRCLDRLNIKPNYSAVTRIQLGANQHSMSTSVVPVATITTTTTQQPYVPHLEQRQIAHRHHHLKSIALSRTVQSSQTESHSVEKNQSILGITTAFLDRMFK